MGELVWEPEEKQETGALFSLSLSLSSLGCLQLRHVRVSESTFIPVSQHLSLPPSCLSHLPVRVCVCVCVCVSPESIFGSQNFSLPNK